eukprot:6652098-Karenia_brevis.AAC.1
MCSTPPLDSGGEDLNTYGFNEIAQSCIPKKDFISYSGGIACKGANTRPLACKNTDNKVLCKSVSLSLQPIVQ